MAARQHKYTAPINVTQNVARVIDIHIQPQAERLVVIYAIGEETAGVFTQNEREVREITYAELGGLSPSTLAVVQDLENRALSYGQSSGVFPAGTAEDVP